MSARTQGPGRWTVARDVLSFFGGWGLIYQQALFVDPDRVNPLFLVIAVALLGVPGISELATRLLPLLLPVLAGTAGSASSPASSPSRPSSGSGPGTDSDGGEQ